MWGDCTSHDVLELSCRPSSFLMLASQPALPGTVAVLARDSRAAVGVGVLECACIGVLVLECACVGVLVLLCARWLPLSEHMGLPPQPSWSGLIAAALKGLGCAEVCAGAWLGTTLMGRMCRGSCAEAAMAAACPATA
jgi:hypothetical protein